MLEHCSQRARWTGFTWFTAPAGLLLALFFLGLTAAPASAHATLLSTDPKNDAVLAKAPTAVTLTFDEAVVVWPTSISIFDPAGERLEVGVKGIDKRAVATLPANLGQGTYTVTWRVISADDHPVSGGFAFTIGKRTTPVAADLDNEPTRSLNVVRLAATALGYLGVLGSIGLAVFELFLLDATAGAMAGLRRRLRWTGRGLIALAALGFFASIPLTTAWQQAGSLASLGDGAIWSDGFSSDLLTSAVLAVAGLLVVALLVGRPYVVLARVGVAVGALVALVSLPWTGHTRTYGPTWLVVASDLIHVSAGAIWAGGIIGLALTLAKSSEASPRRAASTAARFSAVAAWAVLAVAISGTVMAWRILGSIPGLWETSYGKALLVKLGVALVIVGIAAWNRYGLVPKVLREPRDNDARGLLRSAVRAEAACFVVLLAVTGVLVTQPPREEAAASGPGEQVSRARGIEARLGTNLVRMRISPITTGSNYVQLYLRDAAGKALEPLSAPSVRFTQAEEGIGPLSAPMTRVGPGQYEGRVALPVSGDWAIQITARTSKYESPSAELAVHIY
ncbi:copper resistance protein CopC [Kribbella sp. NBC_01245]|uniref:copper resistance protein CopC n=1 Tax=Kribbella sp. NBC_01245 TaxID=2903578 RepID=UPI002E2D9B18|nr:copper resistance protein CopC [Kribbella sp. NBC_01245]